MTSASSTRWENSAPLVIFDAKGLRKNAMRKERVNKEDILHAARELQGIENLEEIRYAVLEQTGDITIVPKHA